MQKYIIIGPLLAIVVAVLCVYCTKNQRKNDQKYKSKPHDRNHNDLY